MEKVSDTPEFDRLAERLFAHENGSICNFQVYWGDKAHELTKEERAKAINDALDDVAAGKAVRSEFAPRSSQPTTNIGDLLERLTPSQQ